MALVWEIDLPPGEKLVLLALADQANDAGTQCWPSVETIAKRSGQGIRTVRRALASLEKAGHLTRDHRDGTSTQYRVHPCSDPARRAEYHYVYRVSDSLTGEFYVGARTCSCPVEQDSYMGSGVWVKEALACGRPLSKEIISQHDNRDALGVAESASIQAVIGLPNCMNKTASAPANLAGCQVGRTKQPLPKTTATPANLAPKPSRTTIKPKEERARELPDGWLPAPFKVGSKSRTIEDGWPPGERDHHLEHFAAHHRSRGSKFKDWQDAWSTWVLNTARFNRKPANDRQPASDEIRNPYARAAVRMQAARAEAGRTGAEWG